MRKPPLVEVTWSDATTRSDAVPLAKAATDAPAIRMTVGFLVWLDEERVVIAATYDPPELDSEAEVGDRHVIPRGWVKSIRYIERGPRTHAVKADGKSEPAKS